MDGIGPVRPKLVTRQQLTRAAVFAGAALAACGGSDEPESQPRVEPTTGGEGATTQPTSSSDATAPPTMRSDGGTPDATVTYNPTEDEIERQLDSDPHYQNHPCTPDGQCAPYGAPPLDVVVI